MGTRPVLAWAKTGEDGAVELRLFQLGSPLSTFFAEVRKNSRECGVHKTEIHENEPYRWYASRGGQGAAGSEWEQSTSAPKANDPRGIR